MIATKEAKAKIKLEDMKMQAKIMFVEKKLAELDDQKPRRFQTGC